MGLIGRVRRRTRIAALAVVTALLLSGCDFSVYNLPLPGGANVGDNPYHVTIMFRDVLDLVPQSSVKVDDISVGRVDNITVSGYDAKVDILLKRSVKLPDNAIATIRQTSLLGEKFVSLAPPPTNPSPNLLGDGDVIGLDHSGRNPEVEEVLGALSLLLNGGGVGQLKTITDQMNKAFGGRESEIRDSLNQLRIFMTQLAGRKNDIVTAIARVNNLSKSLNAHTGDLDLALKKLPSAIKTVNTQRDDLVKMLQALARLSGVGTRVIQASKQGTIDSLNALAPVLANLAKAGTDLPNSLQIFLTFPFIDGVVGKNPQQARDLHMGDYTNLNARIDLNLVSILQQGIGVPGGPNIGLNCSNVTQKDLGQLCKTASGQVKKVTDQLLKNLGGGGGGKGGGLLGGGGGGNPLGGVTGSAPKLGRAPVGQTSAQHGQTLSVQGVDTGLASMLLWGVIPK
jgi:phospholipid/cholesterol/gamma-HCH transport system substrate-binding protein